MHFFITVHVAYGTCSISISSCVYGNPIFKFAVREAFKTCGNIIADLNDRFNDQKTQWFHLFTS